MVPRVNNTEGQWWMRDIDTMIEIKTDGYRALYNGCPTKVINGTLNIFDGYGWIPLTYHKCLK